MTSEQTTETPQKSHWSDDLRALKNDNPEKLKLLRDVAQIRNDPARPGTPEQLARVDALTEANASDFVDWVETLGLVEQIQVMRLLRPAGKLQSLFRDWQKERLHAWTHSVAGVVLYASEDLVEKIDAILTEEP